VSLQQPNPGSLAVKTSACFLPRAATEHSGEFPLSGPNVGYSGFVNCADRPVPMSRGDFSTSADRLSTKSYNSVPNFHRHFLNTKTDSDAYVPRPMPQERISSLREAINSLDIQMADLMSQRQALKAQLEQHVRLQSPVVRLPSELLSSIFVMGVLGMGDGDPVIVPTLMLVWCVDTLT